MLKDKIGYMKS